MTNLEDFQLVEQILAGETEGYRTLVDRHAPMVFHIVNDFVDDPEEAEDLAQEIFVKTYERLSSYKGRSKFSTWLYMIAKNHCRDYAKNIRRQNKTFSEMSSEHINRHMIHEETPHTTVEQEEWHNLLQEGLKIIKNDYAEAFLMKYESGMTYKSMSQRLGASVSALKLRVFRAKEGLKEYIEQNS